MVGSFVGVRGDGVTAKANTSSGVVFVNGSNGVVGGPDLADRNVISGNSQQGIDAGPGTAGLLIRNNVIGPRAGGAAHGGNGAAGPLRERSPGGAAGRRAFTPPRRPA